MTPETVRPKPKSERIAGRKCHRVGSPAVPVGRQRRPARGGRQKHSDVPGAQQRQIRGQHKQRHCTERAARDRELLVQAPSAVRDKAPRPTRWSLRCQRDHAVDLPLARKHGDDMHEHKIAEAIPCVSGQKRREPRLALPGRLQWYKRSPFHDCSESARSSAARATLIRSSSVCINVSARACLTSRETGGSRESISMASMMPA
jgi:hypothetical protein